MRKSILILFILLCLPFVASSQTADSFGGTYNLTDVKTGVHDNTMKMVITLWPKDGPGTFLIRGDGWVGKGHIKGKNGYYDWKFDDGKSTGRTTFTIDSSGCLKGHVYGSGLDWNYSGCRVN
jgi:hypothetical protein